jgi:hypothetical protein
MAIVEWDGADASPVTGVAWTPAGVERSADVRPQAASVNAATTPRIAAGRL